MRIILVFVVVFLVGCTNRGPETAITREVWDAGGGDPSVVSDGALREWFRQHPGFAAHIANECRAVKVHTIDYGDTGEGRVCTAAASATFFAGGEVGRDHVAF